ncbi:MAG: phage integrase family protein [bacterium]|nr:phage integrase family protein [bacterium]
MQLRWSDVDLDRGLVTLRAETTKTSLVRTVDLDASLRSALDALGHRTGPVFLKRPGAPYAITNGTTALRFLKSALERAGIPQVDQNGHHLHLHALRHTFCTRLARFDVPLRKAQAMTGHRRIQTLVEIYQHVGSDEVQGILEALPEVKL